jgi:hypothetical protein
MGWESELATRREKSPGEPRSHSGLLGVPGLYFIVVMVTWLFIESLLVESIVGLIAIGGCYGASICTIRVAIV